MTDYRKIFTEQVCFIPQDWVIHHIDFDRENNNPLNLVAIPKRLHNAYHSQANWVLIRNSGLDPKELHDSVDIELYEKFAKLKTTIRDISYIEHYVRKNRTISDEGLELLLHDCVKEWL